MGSVGEEGPLKQDDLPQAPPRPDGGCCLCGSADQRETGGGTSADPADPSDPASHRFPQKRIRFEICLCPLLKILWSYRFHKLLWSWLFQTRFFQVLRSWIFQVLRSHRQLRLLLWIPKFRCFRVDNHLLCGLPTSAFHCCCCGSGPGWFQEELQCFPGKCQQGARVCRRPS